MERDGTTQQIHDLLRHRLREAQGRDRSPSAAVIDAQSVKTSCNVRESEQGIDAAKKIKGRKRHIVTDTLGLLLAVVVTAASVSDTAAGKELLDVVAAEHPAVSKGVGRWRYQAAVWRRGAQHGIDVEVVTRRPSEKGFRVLSRRWVVEQTLCAARRPVVSPVQPGGTWREVPGSNGLPDAERLKGQEHAS